MFNLNREFILAGKAIFTLEIPEYFQIQNGCKPHYTYRVTHKEANGRFPEAYFVSMLTGPDNTSDYSYIGMLAKETGEIWFTAKSPRENMPIRLLRRAISNVWNGTIDNLHQYGFHVHHESRCGRCARMLTTPQSVESGYGPECIQHI